MVSCTPTKEKLRRGTTEITKRQKKSKNRHAASKKQNPNAPLFLFVHGMAEKVLNILNAILLERDKSELWMQMMIVKVKN